MSKTILKAINDLIWLDNVKIDREVNISNQTIYNHQRTRGIKKERIGLDYISSFPLSLSNVVIVVAAGSVKQK